MVKIKHGRFSFYHRTQNSIQKNGPQRHLLSSFRAEPHFSLLQAKGRKAIDGKSLFKTDSRISSVLNSVLDVAQTSDHY